jgi:hypothetical protein
MLQEGEAAGGFWNRRVSIRRLAGYLSMFSEHREDVATAKSCATCRRVADYTIGGSSSKGQLNIKVRSETLDAFYSIADAVVTENSVRAGDAKILSRIVKKVVRRLN